MSYTLANMTMDDIKTVRETANSVAKLAAIPDECTLDAQVPNVHRRLVFTGNTLMDGHSGPLPWNFSVKLAKTLSY